MQGLIFITEQLYFSIKPWMIHPSSSGYSVFGNVTAPETICSWCLGKVTVKAGRNPGLISLLDPFSVPSHKTVVFFPEARGRSDLTLDQIWLVVKPNVRRCSYSRLSLPKKTWAELSSSVTAFGGCAPPPPFCGCSQTSLASISCTWSQTCD